MLSTILTYISDLFCFHAQVTRPIFGKQTCTRCFKKRTYQVGEKPGAWGRA